MILKAPGLLELEDALLRKLAAGILLSRHAWHTMLVRESTVDHSVSVPPYGQD
jgi:hypothetical protein